MLKLADELSHPISLIHSLCLALLLHQSRREVQGARERAEVVIALSTEQGFPYWLASGTFHRGWTLAEGGQVEEGIAQMRQGLAAYRTTGAEITVPFFISRLAEVYEKVGQDVYQRNQSQTKIVNVIWLVIHLKQ